MISAAPESIGFTQHDHIPAGGNQLEERRNFLQGGTTSRGRNSPRIHDNQTAPNGVTTWKPPASKSSLDDFGERVIQAIKPPSCIMDYCPPEISQRVERNTKEMRMLFRQMAEAKDSGEITKLKNRVKSKIIKVFAIQGLNSKDAYESCAGGIAELAKYLRYLDMGESGNHDHRKKGEDLLGKAAQGGGDLPNIVLRIRKLLSGIVQKESHTNSRQKTDDLIVRKKHYLMGVFGRNTSGNKPSRERLRLFTLHWNSDDPQLNFSGGFRESVRKSFRTNYNLVQILIDSARHDKRAITPRFWNNDNRERLSNEFGQLLQEVNGILSDAGVKLDEKKTGESRELLYKVEDETNITNIVNKIREKLSERNSSSSQSGGLFDELFSQVATFIREGIKAEYYKILEERDPFKKPPKRDHIRKSRECLENVRKICKEIVDHQNLTKKVEKLRENRSCQEKGENRFPKGARYGLYFSKDVASKNILIDSLIKGPTGSPFNKITRHLGRRKREKIDTKWNALLQARGNCVERRWSQEIDEIVKEHKRLKISVPDDVQKWHRALQRAKKAEELDYEFVKASNEYQDVIREIWDTKRLKIAPEKLEGFREQAEAILSPLWETVEEIKKNGMMPLVTTEDDLTKVDKLHTAAIARVHKLCEDIKKTKSAPPPEADGERRKQKWMRTAIWATAAIAGVGIIVAAAALAPVAAVAVPVIIAGSVLCLVGAWRASRAVNARESTGRLARWWRKWVS